MKKIYALFFLTAVLSHGSELYVSESVSVEIPMNETIQRIDNNILQPVADYLANQAAEDLNKGIIFVQETVIPLVEEKIIAPTKDYVQDQLPNDLKKIETEFNNIEKKSRHERKKLKKQSKKELKSFKKDLKKGWKDAGFK